MANLNAPRGLTPVSNMSGAPYNGSTRQFIHAVGDTQAIYVGDLVTATGDSVFVNTGGTLQSFPIAAQFATGGIQDGVCIGVDLITRDSPVYAPASAQVVITVAVDPEILCLVQDNASGTALTANDVGNNCDILVNQGSVVTGYSGMVLNNATEAGTNTLDVKIMGQYQIPGNDLGSSVSAGAANGQYLVKLNRHRLANQVAGV
jgi:hypothetical protein